MEGTICRLALYATVLIGTAVTAQDVPYEGGNHPQHAKPGEVWCLVTIPPTYKTVTEAVLCQPASCRYEIIPATYKTVTEQVLCKPEGKRCIEIPATYKTVTEQVVCTPESKRCIEIPATYKTVTEQVLCKPESTRCVDIPAVYKTETYQVEKCSARSEWQEVPCDKVKVATDGSERKGVCMALVAIPAVMETKSRQVLLTPASTRTETVPATYKTVTKAIVDTPASKKYEVIPATYKTVTKEVVDTPASKKYEVVPAVYKSVEKQVCVTEESKRKIEIPAVYKTVTKSVCDQPEKKVWRLSDCPAPVGVNNCEHKKAPCDPCGERTVYMYDASYNDGTTQHIHSVQGHD